MKTSIVLRAIAAWTRSLPSVILGPALIWLICALVGPFWILTIAEGMMAYLVHLTSYAIVGLPAFVYGFAKPRSTFWATIPAILVGGGFGFGAAVFHAATLGVNSKILIIGTFCGLWSAGCALRHRPERKITDQSARQSAPVRQALIKISALILCSGLAAFALHY